MPVLSGSELVQAAHDLAQRVFDGVTDRQGVPYLEHCKAVAANTGSSSPVLRAAALLHDVIEDTATTYDDLRAAGFPEAVITLVEAVTRRTEETYAQFIERVKASGSDAVRLKLADIAHNTDPTRGEMKEGQMKRYAKAKATLTDGMSN